MFDRAALRTPLANDEHDRRAAVVADRRFRNEHAAGRGRGGRVTEERHLHAHVGQETRVELVEGGAHLHGGLLPIGRGNDGADLGRDLPVRICVEDRGDGLPVADPRDVRLVHVHLDLERGHVDDGRDARAREPAAGRHRRHHLAALRVLRDDDAAERRAHRAVVEILLGDLDSRLGDAHLFARDHEPRLQAVHRHAGLIAGLLGHELALPQLVDPLELPLGVVEIDSQVAEGRGGRVTLGHGRCQPGARVGIVEPRQHLAGLDLQALVDVDLVDARGDLGGDGGSLPRGDVAAGVQQGRAAALVGAHGSHLDLRGLLAQRDEEAGRAREHHHERHGDRAPAESP